MEKEKLKPGKEFYLIYHSKKDGERFSYISKKVMIVDVVDDDNILIEELERHTRFRIEASCLFPVRNLEKNEI
jgi:hypothetical protein